MHVVRVDVLDNGGGRVPAITEERYDKITETPQWRHEEILSPLVDEK